jgi:hypothetical protein
MDHDLRLPRLLRELEDRGVTLRLENGQLHVQTVARGRNVEHGEGLSAELCDEVSELRAELVAYLRTDGEEVIDDPEERAHFGMRTLPRTPEEVEKQRADADRVREAGRRRYQNGAVLINDPNNFGHYMRQLRRQREASEAAERGELPPQGYYQRKWDIFG